MIWQLPVMMDFAPVHPKHPKHPFRSMEGHWNTPFPKPGRNAGPSLQPDSISGFLERCCICNGTDPSPQVFHGTRFVQSKPLWSANDLPRQRPGQTVCLGPWPQGALKLATMNGPFESQQALHKPTRSHDWEIHTGIAEDFESSWFCTCRAARYMRSMAWRDPGCYALFHARDFHDHNWSGHPKAGPTQNTWNMKSSMHMHMSMHCRISLTSDPPKKCWASDNCGAALATMVKLVGGRITIIPDIVLPGLRAKIILKKGKVTGWQKLAGTSLFCAQIPTSQCCQAWIPARPFKAETANCEKMWEVLEEKHNQKKESKQVRLVENWYPSANHLFSMFFFFQCDSCT